MYANIRLEAELPGPNLVIPQEAVIDTGVRQVVDLGKSLGEPLLIAPHADLAHSGGVDDSSPFGQGDKFPVGGGVTTLSVSFPDLPDLHALFTQQTVDKGGLAHTG